MSLKSGKKQLFLKRQCSTDISFLLLLLQPGMLSIDCFVVIGVHIVVLGELLVVVRVVPIFLVVIL